MNATSYGVIATAPGADGLGTVVCGDATRLVYFQPQRFAAPWPVPTVGDRVAVGAGTPQAIALWLIGQGAPSYVYTGGA